MKTNLAKTAKLSTLALAMGLASMVHAGSETFTASNDVLFDLETGQVTTDINAADLRIRDGQLHVIKKNNVTSAYANTTDYSAVNSLNGYSLKPTFGEASKNVNLVRWNNDSLNAWNQNWWGGPTTGGNPVWGLNLDDDIKPFGGDKRYGLQALQVKDANGRSTKGLVFPRNKDSQAPGVDKRDLVALPYNQLIVRTSKGNKYVRLRAVSMGDPQSASGERLTNWASNNLYFKYAVAGADGVFGTEKNMCIGFSTGSKAPYPLINKNNKTQKDTVIDANTTFNYSFAKTDVWYKQQFVDFDRIIQGPGNGPGTKNTARVPNAEGKLKVDVSAYQAALNQGYPEACIPAFYDDRKGGTYPAMYTNGFNSKVLANEDFTGSDAPVSTRRADWLHGTNGNDEWDVGFGIIAAPDDWYDLVNATWTLKTSFIVNSGRIGQLRSKAGYAAAVLVPGSNPNVSASQNIGQANGSYNLVNNIDEVRPELGGKTVRQSFVSNGKSAPEQYDSIDSDASGNIKSNQRVYVMQDAQGKKFKFQLGAFNAVTGQHTLNFDQLP